MRTRTESRRHGQSWPSWNTRALEAQDRTEEVSKIRSRFEKAWEAADIMVPSSTF